MITNEWKSIIKSLDSAGMHGLTELTPQELAKLHALLDHWQKLTGGERLKRHETESVTA